MRPRRPSGRRGSSPSTTTVRLTEKLRLGFDTTGCLLETVVLVFESGHQLVIHAMPARKKYLDLLP
jgi:hypothetical protein